MERFDGETNVIYIDDYLLHRFQRLVSDCRREFRTHLPDSMLRHDPFAVAMAIADHFVEQLNELIQQGKFTPEGAMEYALGVLAKVARRMPNGEERRMIASRARPG